MILSFNPHFTHKDVAGWLHCVCLNQLNFKFLLTSTFLEPQNENSYSYVVIQITTDGSKQETLPSCTYTRKYGPHDSGGMIPNGGIRSNTRQFPSPVKVKGRLARQRQGLQRLRTATEKWLVFSPHYRSRSFINFQPADCKFQSIQSFASG